MTDRKKTPERDVPASNAKRSSDRAERPGGRLFEQREAIERLARYFCERIPHNAALALEFVALDPGRAQIRLPYRDHLVGNPENRVLHGGAITALMDAACGAAVFTVIRAPRHVATLDLRIDYLRPASPGKDVIADAECYRLTRNVAFVRGIAFHDDPEDAIASCAGTFIILGPGGQPISHPVQGDSASSADLGQRFADSEEAES